MIEEYIQGESLETFVSHQKSISEELIVKLAYSYATFLPICIICLHTRSCIRT